MRKVLAVVGLVLGAGVAMAQDATMPPANEHVVQTVQGRGVQIYTCKAVSGAGQWVFVAPAARLFDKGGIEVGTHGDGPVWNWQDASFVQGQVVSKLNATDASAVPWLLLKATRTGGSGQLGGVEYIRRSETKGGSAPAGTCDEGALLRVSYEATYTFYSAK